MINHNYRMFSEAGLNTQPMSAITEFSTSKPPVLSA